MRKFLSIATVALLATGVLAVGAGPDAGADAGQPQRPVAEGDHVTAERVSELPAAMERMHRMAARLERMVARNAAALDTEFTSLQAVNCKTVECLNGELTELSRFATKTSNRLNKLDAFARAQGDLWDAWYSEWNNCVPVSPVTQYDGYFWSPDGGVNTYLTTGLDYTYGSDPVSDWVLVWTCGVT